MKRWSPEEISKLKSMAQDYPAAKIAEALGRGRSASFVAFERSVRPCYPGGKFDAAVTADLADRVRG
jgi:hypothetical protein